MYENTTYHGRVGEHAVELDFDTRKVVLNSVRLRVDGVEVDSTKVWYGEKELTTTLADGTEIAAVVHSGMVGEATRVQLRGADGTFTDLQPS